jgi:hypothetical protein
MKKFIETKDGEFISIDSIILLSPKVYSEKKIKDCYLVCLTSGRPIECMIDEAVISCFRKHCVRDMGQIA